MRLVTMHHGNIPNTPVVVDVDLVFTYYHSAQAKCTYLVAQGGAVMPVSETVEQVSQLKTGMNQEPKGESNGTI